MSLVPRLLALLALLGTLSLALAACGDSEEEPTSTEASSTSSTSSSSGSTTGTTTTVPATAEPISTTPSVSESCSDVETYDVESGGTHFNREFTAQDYPTNPPTAGDHNPSPLPTGQFYDSPPPLGETVHALEHGAVIAWTNGLSTEEIAVAQDAVDTEFKKGYYQVAVVENPDLEVPFALSSWDSLQRCEAPDPEAISTFIDKHYAPSTTAEGSLACSVKAKRLPACRSRTDPS